MRRGVCQRRDAAHRAGLGMRCTGMQTAFREESRGVISPRLRRYRGRRVCIYSAARSALHPGQADHPFSASRHAPGSQMRAAVCPRRGDATRKEKREGALT